MRLLCETMVMHQAVRYNRMVVNGESEAMWGKRDCIRYLSPGTIPTFVL